MQVQMVRFATIEMNGLTDIQDETYPVDLSIDECMARYKQSRYLQSIKGFRRPLPLSVEFDQVLWVGDSKDIIYQD
jgi:hypothetical protein